MLTLEDIYQIYDKHKQDYNSQVEEFTIGNKNFKFNSQSAILGVVNLSTDSWFKHSICYTPEQAIRRSKVLNAQGADIIDIGLEASSAKTERVDEFKQISSAIPVLKALHQEGILTSIETYYPEVARECLEAGGNVINFTGTENSEEMYQVVADFDAAIIICYMEGNNARSLGEFDYQSNKDPIDLVYDYCGKEIEKATKLGVRKIFLDPALGLGYTNFYYQHENVSNRMGYQLRSTLNAFRLRKLGFPIANQMSSALEIVGEEIRSGQMLAGVFAVLGKTDLFRTHEVPKLKVVLDTFSLL